MTDFAALLRTGGEATPLHLIDARGFPAWSAALDGAARAGVAAARFRAKPDTLAWLGSAGWAAGVADAGAPGRWCLAAAAERLPAGAYRADVPPAALHGWLMAQHRGPGRAADDEGARTLAIACDARPAILEAEAAATVRDLVDLPANRLGPEDLANVVVALGVGQGAEVTVIEGDELAAGFPAVHAVGRASARPPRVVRLDWGSPAHPRLAIVGKGVCFDSGGLNLKPGAGMALMKKDMGGAAHAIALAARIMAAGLPVRLTLVVGAVENSVGPDAMRPGDVLDTRAGKRVEVGNTDAEGRLVLADCLTYACEGDAPDLCLDFATLTGAARVALGPELPALFANDDALAAAWLAAGERAGDPLWRLPLWQGYRSLFRSDVADMNNNAEGGFAGAIVGALFCESFVPARMPWAHLDLFAWNPAAKPGRPKGGHAQAIHAAFAMIQERYGC